MKKNFDTTALIKAAGWAFVAIGGLMSSWAADKELKKETTETHMTLTMISRCPSCMKNGLKNIFRPSAMRRSVR